MLIQHLGLEIEGTGWGLFLLTVVVWLGSIRFVTPVATEGWTAIPKSLIGYAWIAFGVDVVLRFLILAYDSVTFGNMTFRLASIPAPVVHQTILLSGAFWLCVAIGFRIMLKRRTRGVFLTLPRFTAEMADRPLNLVTIVSTACIFLAVGPDQVPLAALTLATHLGMFWMVPAVLVWWRGGNGARNGMGSRLRKWLLLVPGLVLGLLSPYREHLLSTVVAPFVAGLYAGRRYRLRNLVPAIAIFLVITTLAVSVLRDLYWYGKSLDETLETQRMTFSLEEPESNLLTILLRRFHGFDSFLLTVDRVPRVFNYADRNLLVETIVRIGVPRIFHPEKGMSDRGPEFARTIWGYGEQGESEAAIAPSMMGDLYSVGGSWYVILGGLFWGGVIGAFEGWKSHLPAAHQAVVTSLYATLTAAGIERDFVHVIGTYVQMQLLLFLTMALLPVVQAFRETGERPRPAREPSPPPADNGAGPQRIPPPRLLPDLPFEASPLPVAPAALEGFLEQTTTGRPAPRREGAPAIQSNRIRRILVYRSGAIGDTLVAVPAVRAIREAFPGSPLILMTASEDGGTVWTDQVLREFGWCDSYVTYTASELRSVRSLWGVLRRVRQARPSLAVHLGSDKNSWLRIWRDRLFFRLGGARRTIACPSNKVTAWGGLRRDRRIYPLEVDRLLAGMQRYGIQRPGTLFGLPIGNDQAGRVAAVLEASGLDRGRPLVGMCPGSKQQAKRWPVERYGELGRRLIEEAGANVAIVGGPDEAQIGAVLGRAWPPGRWVNAAGKLTVLESAALLRGCLFYVGNDTGAMHLAAAVGTRCVAVFSAREPARSWEPYGENHIVLRRDVPCQNCYLSTCGVEQLRCLTGIPVDDVWAACRRMLVYR